ncbi:acetyltransferase [Sorangium cellulosum]|uniref:Acetyltransferase n=1 Tax=Sorangium cellulosum TaxID=56 RepID=A0A2L0EHF7_SORCE|nr:GNAT family N-acetyltransferase [Sorangium cellulosum]AUX38719.1 acetyltransferase [Sorangium cellulosum]
MSALLAAIERFYDAVPRRRADAEVHGPLTLFVRRGDGWPYYARPTLGHAGPVSVDDMAAMRARQRGLSFPESFEWVLETTPGLDAAAEAAGLHVRRCPLLVLSGEPVQVAAPADVSLGLVTPDDPDLAAVQAVAYVAFGAFDTAAGLAGPAERDATAAALPAGHATSWTTSLIDGTMVHAAARGRAGELAGPLCVGSYQHAEEVAEIVGVGTLPAARRRGLAAAVTAVLARRALDAGNRTVFLSAQNDDVARVYERVGFRRVATACIAEPPEQA